MRTFHHFTCGLTAGMALWLMVCPALDAAAQNGLPRTATVARLEGKARFSTDSKTWQTARNGSVLSAGTVLQTADNSTLDLRLGESGTAASSTEPEAGFVRLAPNSVLAIDRLSAESAAAGSAQVVELDLRVGQITGRVGQLATGSRYEVKFASGVAGVRSGLYRLTASGMVDAMTGKVIVVRVGADGTAAPNLVTAGHRLNPATGQITDIPANPTGDLPAAKPQPMPEPARPANPPASPSTKGPGMGGALRKF